MPETPLKELDVRLQKQVKTADQSIERGNASYAVDICKGILKQHPECLEVRKILRKAQKKLASSKGKGSSMFSGVTNAPFMVKAHNQIKKDPMSAIDTAEKMLQANPHNMQAQRLLGQAAEVAELYKTAIFAYESVEAIDPKNAENLIMLGEAHLKNEDSDAAVHAAERLLQNSPGNGDAQDLIRRASVKQSIEKGKWDEEDTDFHEKLRDEDQAVKLEQESRNVNDAETLMGLIQEIYGRIEEEPENINLYKQIAQYYRKLGDHATAIEWINYARTFPTGAADTTLESLVANLYAEQIEQYIENQEQELEADPDNEEIKQNIEDYRQYLHDFRLQTAKEYVDKYPNDYNQRFELGKLYYEAGQSDAAIQQFQLSQRNPKVRPNSLLYMGRAFKQGQKYDLAIEQLQTLKKELQLMDDTKKSTIYELAEAYEYMGSEQEAIEEYKNLYQHDISYRDVADKINAFYASQG